MEQRLTKSNIKQVQEELSPTAAAVVAHHSESESECSKHSLDHETGAAYVISQAPTHWDRDEVGAHGSGPKAPNRERDDVGTYAVLCGNWGGGRGDADMQRHIDTDLQSSPGTVLLLQEAQEALARVLSLPPTGAGARGGGPCAREKAEFHVIRGHEACNTLLVAARIRVVESLDELLWMRTSDGLFTRSKNKVEALSRLLVCLVTFAKPHHGQKDVVVASAHMHYATAKKMTGLGPGHERWWKSLGDACVENRVRILGGDFNMSAFIVAEKLRDQGIEVALGAWTAFLKGDCPHADSCGVWILGPAGSIRSLVSAEDFELGNDLPYRRDGQGYPIGSYLPTSGPGALSSLRLSLPAPAVAGQGAEAERAAEDAGEGVAKGKGATKGATKGNAEGSVAPAVAGQGATASSSAAAGSASAAAADAVVAGRVVTPEQRRGPGGDATALWPRLPSWSQKEIEKSLFDPHCDLDGRGAHWPLLGFLGDRSYRSLEGLERREQKKKDKRASKREAARHPAAAAAEAPAVAGPAAAAPVPAVPGPVAAASVPAVAGPAAGTSAPAVAGPAAAASVPPLPAPPVASPLPPGLPPAPGIPPAPTRPCPR